MRRDDLTLISPAASNPCIQSFRSAGNELHHLIFLLLIIGFFTVGCGGRSGYESPYSQEELRSGVYQITADSDSIQARLAERVTPLDRIWLKSDVKIRREGERGSDFFIAKAMAERPERLRFRATRIPIGTLFDALINGESAYLHFPSEGAVYIGTKAELRRKLKETAGMKPDDFVAAALAMQELRDRLTRLPHVIRQRNRDELTIAAIDEEAGQQIIWRIGIRDGLIREALVRDLEGMVLVRATYHRYRMEELNGRNEPFPEEVTLEFPREGVSAEADVSEYRLGQELPRAAWTPPRARETYPIQSLQFESAK